MAKKKAKSKQPAKARRVRPRRDGDKRDYRYLCLQAEIRTDAEFVPIDFAPLFSKLLERLGDHKVEWCASKLKGAAWASDLPWRQRYRGYVCGLTVALSAMTDPAFLRAIFEMTDDGPHHIGAHSGSGAYRHLRWMLFFNRSRYHMPGGPLSEITLFLCGDHLLPEAEHSLAERRARPAIDAIVHEFYRAVASAGVLVDGRGEVREGDFELFCFGSLASDSAGRFESWIADALRQWDQEAGLLLLPGPSFITVLSDAHLARLGGLDAFRARMLDWEARFYTLDKNKLSKWDHSPQILPVPGGAIIILSHLTDVVRTRDTGYSSHVRGPTRALKWLLTELHDAGLLSQSRGKWIDEDYARTVALRAKRETDEVAQRASARRKKLEPPRKIKLEQYPPPRCIRSPLSGIATSPDAKLRRVGVTTYAVKPSTATNEPGMPPLPDSWGDQPTTDAAGSSSKSKTGRSNASAKQAARTPGLAIYARGSGSDDDDNASDADALFPPVLVGSLTPERAALFFDSRIHGWDGEHAPPVPESARPFGRLAQHVCSRCQGRVFEVWASFEHDETDEGMDGDARSRPQDFFTWFWLTARCVACSKIETVVDYECA